MPSNWEYETDPDQYMTPRSDIKPPLETVLDQMRSNALLLRAVRICGSADTLKKGRSQLARFAFGLPYPDLEALFVNAIEVLTIKMAADCPNKEEFLHTLDTVSGVLHKITES